MKFLLSSLVVLSIASLAESWVLPGCVTDVGSSRSTRITTTTTTTTETGRKTTTIALRDVIDGNPQWYAGSQVSTTSSNEVSQDAIDRKLRNAAEQFMKFQSGYFSPMMPNNNNNNNNNGMNGFFPTPNANTNGMNGMTSNGFSPAPSNGYNNNNNNGYDNNGYNNGYDNNGYDAYDTSSILAEDFVFRGPVIGPLTKWDYIEALDYFRIYETFPDINPNCYGFTVDIVEPLKVRFFVKATGTYQNPLGGFLGTAASKLTPPDGRQYMGSTEAWSVTFNDLDSMQVKSISAGYVVDRFEEEGLLCTTDGKGLVYGILNTIGLDFLPTNPGSKPLELAQWLTGQFAKGGPGALFPKASSDPKTIPQWWSDKRLGAEE